MIATHEALCERGYADLTAQDIADRTGKSKARLFYHYDSTDALLADFLEFLLERFERTIAATADRPPVDRLGTFVDGYLSGADGDAAIHAAVLELRARAPQDERYRTRLADSDDRLRAVLEEILRDGKRAGQFTDHDPARVAMVLLATLDGALVRNLSVGRDSYPETVRAATGEFLLESVLADGVAFPPRRDVDPVGVGYDGECEDEPDDGESTGAR